VDSPQKLYRFFSLPGDITDLLARDNIDVTEETTIEDVLTQRVQLQEKLNKEIFPDPNLKQQKIIEESLNFHKLPEPYFSLYKINYLLNKELLWVSKLGVLNDISEYTKWTTGQKIENLALEQGKNLSKDERLDLNRDLAKYDGYLPFNILEAADYYGVVSFCLDNVNSTMWAHYANGHAGVCIGFESLISFIREEKFHSGYYVNEDGTPGLMHHWQKICYKSVTPAIWGVESVEHYKSLYEEMLKESPELTKYPINHFSLAITNSIFQKAPCWTQEQELRLLLTGLENNISLNKFIDLAEKKPYLSLSDLYFGLNVKDDVKRLIRNSVKAQLNYWQSTPKGGSFDIKFVKL
jgi:hypothetical protein